MLYINHFSIHFHNLHKFTRSQFCNRCNDKFIHNCDNNFIITPKILVLVVKRFDSNLRNLTSKLNATIALKVSNHGYQIKCWIEHHGETINKEHYTAASEYNNRWLQCDDLVINPVKIHRHLGIRYIIFIQKFNWFINDYLSMKPSYFSN